MGQKPSKQTRVPTAWPVDYRAELRYPKEKMPVATHYRPPRPTPDQIQKASRQNSYGRNKKFLKKSKRSKKKRY